MTSKRLLEFFISSLMLSALVHSEAKFKVGTIEGQFIIGGLFPIHQLSSKNKCSKEIGAAYGIQRLEAMIYAIDKINKEYDFDFKIGAEMRDSCNLEPTALDESIRFVFDTDQKCQSNISGSKNEKLLGVVGGSLSSVTGQVASLLRLFKIPQISYGSTSVDLSDRTKYDYLLRTVPSDYYQAKAMVDFIVKELKWNTIYGINSLGNYGVRGMDAFKEAAKAANICIIDSKQISLKSTDDEIKAILHEFHAEPGVRGVVLFCEMQDVQRLLKVTESLGLAGHFRWVASDAWGSKYPSSAIRAAENTVSVSLHFPEAKSKKFYNYFSKLTPISVDKKRNPWFNEFWNQNCEHVIKQGTEVHCDPRNDGEGRGEMNLTSFRLCQPYNKDLTCVKDDKVPYVIDAVYAFAEALKNMIYIGCNLDRQCIKSVKRPEFFTKFLKNVSFHGVSGDVSFGEDVLKGSYDFNWFREGKFDKIGRWERGKMNVTDLWTKHREGESVSSSCGKNCSNGYARHLKKKNSCCWSCVRCAKRQYLRDLYECKDCEPGQRPNNTLNGCEKLPLRHWNSAWHITISLLASVGLCMTVFVTVVYVKYNHTPIIKASGRELQYMLLCGLTLSYSLPFVMALYPHPIVCGVTRFGTGFCICICYAALLIKTNRIARIFSGTQDPLFITPVWQVLLTAVFVLPQVLIGVSGLVTTPPETAFDYHEQQFTVVRCNASVAELVISIGYNLLLVFSCTIYAFMTRKVPENFNEARYIVFVMYTTCAIWLTFLPVFYGANADYRSIAISLNLILNATTILVGLFAMKIYVVLLRPEKNNRANSRVRSKSELSAEDKNGVYRVNCSRCDSPDADLKAYTITNANSSHSPSLNETSTESIDVRGKKGTYNFDNMKFMQNGYALNKPRVSMC